jgi:predicted CXXCH cytochrome family protein
MSHTFRPVWLVIGVVVLILIARQIFVPPDFGIGERGFMYGYHRMSNEEDWKAVEVKYKTKEYCQDCHYEKYEDNMGSRHKIIQCENCHGPARDHPENPLKLVVDRSRKLCLRCHTFLPYPTSQRSQLPGIIPEEHNPDVECSMCHNPHKPDLGGIGS